MYLKNFSCFILELQSLVPWIRSLMSTKGHLVSSKGRAVMNTTELYLWTEQGSRNLTPLARKKKIPDVSRRTNIQTFVFLFFFLLISCFNSLSQRWQSYWWKLMCNFKILYYQCEWVIPWWLCEFIYIRFWKLFFFSEIILCMWVSSAMW